MTKQTFSRTIGGFAAAALVAVGMAAAVPHIVAAQDPTQGPPPMGRMGGHGRGGPGGFGREGGPMALGIDPRDLTDAQQQQTRSILNAHKDEMKPLMDRLEKAHDALSNAVLSGGGDLRGLAAEVGAAEGEVALEHAQIESEIFAILSPDQKAKIQQRRQDMDARRQQMQQRRQARGSKGGNAK
jgi:Spy/CpxP family protein refolding chaperone